MYTLRRVLFHDNLTVKYQIKTERTVGSDCSTGTPAIPIIKSKFDGLAHK